MKISLLAFALLGAQATASYVRSCNNCRLEKKSSAWLSGEDYAPVLLCDCKQTNGHRRTSRLDLNSCVANDDGRMVPRSGGGLGHSCHNFGLGANGKSFSAFCKMKPKK